METKQYYLTSMTITKTICLIKNYQYLECAFSIFSVVLTYYITIDNYIRNYNEIHIL